MSYIICDLDGTLCNAEHRLHFIDKKIPDWQGFFDHISEDSIYETVDAMIKKCNDYTLVFVTGRPEKFRASTVEWLKIHGYIDFQLFMRQDGDFRHDNVIKEELYHKKIRPQLGKPFLIFDDRNQVVAMWRRLGLTCFQVKDGDY